MDAQHNIYQLNATQGITDLIHDSDSIKHCGKSLFCLLPEYRSAGTAFNGDLIAKGTSPEALVLTQLDASYLFPNADKDETHLIISGRYVILHSFHDTPANFAMLLSVSGCPGLVSYQRIEIPAPYVRCSIDRGFEANSQLSLRHAGWELQDGRDLPMKFAITWGTTHSLNPRSV